MKLGRKATILQGRKATAETPSHEKHIFPLRCPSGQPSHTPCAYAGAPVGELPRQHQAQGRRHLNTNSRTEIRKAEPAPKKNKKTTNKKARSEKPDATISVELLASFVFGRFL